MKMRAVVAAWVLVALILSAFPVLSGTIIFKDGTVLTDVEIVGINDGMIVIEKDKTKKDYPLKNIKTFSKSDLSIADSAIPDDSLDYKITIVNVDMPEAGKNKSANIPETGKSNKSNKIDTGNTSKNKGGEQKNCEITYSISKIPDKNSKSKKIKIPYFYLYVLTSKKNDEEGRKVYRFCYPDKAKPKGKNYDLATIMEKVKSFDRPDLEEEEITLETKVNLAGRTVTFNLGTIGERKVLAYHVEAWGKTDIAAEKTQNVLANVNPSSVEDKWWQKL